MANSSGGDVSDIFMAPFRRQILALIMGVSGFVMIRDVPVGLAFLLKRSGIERMTDQSTMATGMTIASFGEAAISVIPTIRLIGIVLLLLSSVALLTRSNLSSYRRVIRSRQLSTIAGVATLGLAVYAANAGISVPMRDPTATAQRTQPAVPPAIMRPDVEPSAAPDAPVAMATTARTMPVAADAGSDAPTSSLTPNLGQRETLAGDRPFPANGTIERTLPLKGASSTMTFVNGSRENVIVLWFYNVGGGEQEALRAYIRAGQSTNVVLPTFDYRMAMYSAPLGYGLDSGFGPDSRMRDLGFIGMKVPTRMLTQLPVFSVYGFGLTNFQKGRGTMRAR